MTKYRSSPIRLKRFISFGLAIAIVALFAFSIGLSRVAECPNTTNLTYEEIRTHIESITKTPEHPDGPEVGLDGIVDPKIREALGAYQQCVVGKNVEGWQGWLTEGGFTEVPPGVYNVAVFIEQPKPGVEAHAEIVIVNVSIADAERMRVWRDNQQRVTFSGVIAGTQSDGRVYISDVVMEPSP